MWWKWQVYRQSGNSYAVEESFFQTLKRTNKTIDRVDKKIKFRFYKREAVLLKNGSNKTLINPPNMAFFVGEAFIF